LIAINRAAPNYIRKFVPMTIRPSRGRGLPLQRRGAGGGAALAARRPARFTGLADASLAGRGERGPGLGSASALAAALPRPLAALAPLAPAAPCAIIWPMGPPLGPHQAALGP
jgi:hypothetical protein